MFSNMLISLMALSLVLTVTPRVIHVDDALEMPSKRSHHGKHHKHKHSGSMFDGEDFQLFDENQDPYVNCAHLDPITRIAGTVKCPLSSEASMGPRSNGLACFTVFNDDQILSQGCWVHQDQEALDQCTPKKCVAKTDPEDPDSMFQFCCCRGHECNREFQIAEDAKW